MKYSIPENTRQPLYKSVLDHYRCDEAEQLKRLLAIAEQPEAVTAEIEAEAARLVEAVRQESANGSGIDAFMQEYDLSSAEGVVLMCLAEALLRIPDKETVDKLIEDKIGGSNWESHLGESKSWFVNASTWGLMVSGRMLRRSDAPQKNFSQIMKGMLRRSGEPFIRQGVRQAMRIMGHQFVMGRTIDEGLANAHDYEQRGYTYSYDMLGEAARTDADAQRFYDEYENAITACGKASNERGPELSHGVSVKLSALHARYELSHRQRVLDELLPRLQRLARLSAKYNINMTIDAEEASRLDLSLELLELVSADPELGDWQGLGLAVQAYQKRALDVIEWLADLSKRHHRRFMVRLVKGAYWDTEVKLAQEQGLDGYPVFTRKANTDVSYMACAKRMLEHKDAFYGQFATHNAHTLAYIRQLAAGRDDFEFQRLHGMGESLHAQIMDHSEGPHRCRIYAPVGQHADLLAYLVRRLLENGANSSFVNRVVDEDVPVAEIVVDPVRHVRSQGPAKHPRIPLPLDLYGPTRRNSKGVDLSDVLQLESLAAAINDVPADSWQGGALINGELSPLTHAALEAGEARAVVSPADNSQQVGQIVWTQDADIESALATATAAAPAWAQTPAAERAACLQRYADLLESHMGELIALCAREAGKNIADGIAEVREAVDFCHYYAAQIEREADAGLQGRGVFVAICPWNFPLAIFTGQVAAALAAGNAVIAKPAEQSGLIGVRAVKLMHEAGVPVGAVACLPGGGDVGAKLIADARVAGVAFTGSLPTAQSINRTLAARPGPAIPLIAETGGQNAMIVDSSALIEQVVADVIRSGFQSAGQRCSALRVLFVQEDIADDLITMLSGAMQELSIGDPLNLGTDVTPVIDAKAQKMLSDYAGIADTRFTPLYRCELDNSAAKGTYFAPRAYEVASVEQLEGEKFGPIVHVLRFSASEIDQVVDQINGMGFGLTFGIHSRIDNTVERVIRRLHVGNSYINRNMIGAVVGVQPFGGEGLSGTGPKAGGPHYLHRFAANASKADVATSVATSVAAVTAEAADATAIDAAMTAASAAASSWEATNATARAACLRRYADLLDTHADTLATLGQREAADAWAGGKTDVTKAARLCRYYADQAAREFSQPQVLPGPTGERNTYSQHGRGVFVVAGSQQPSLSIFCGQMAAALAAGNSVVATPGLHLTLVGERAVSLMHDAGVPVDVVSWLAGGIETRDVLAADARAAGIAFNGDEAAVQTLNGLVAKREGAIIPLVADGDSPYYLHRFATERAVSWDTTAAGGNASLMSLEEDEPDEHEFVTPEPQRYGAN